MATRKTVKTAAKKATLKKVIRTKTKKRSKRTARMAPTDLRTLVYLWLYSTLTDIRKADTGGHIGTVTPGNIDANVSRVTTDLQNGGADVDIDVGCLTSIYGDILDAHTHVALMNLRDQFFAAAKAMKNPPGWSGGQDHPEILELNSILGASGGRAKGQK